MFPVPLCKPLRCGGGGSPRASKSRDVAVVRETNAAIRGLSWLAGFPSSTVGPAKTVMREAVRARFRTLVERQPPALDAPGQEAALRELLKGASLYDEHRSSTTLAPFNSDLVSCPDKLERCKLVSELLPASDRIFLEDLERMLLKDSAISD